MTYVRFSNLIGLITSIVVIVFFVTVEPVLSETTNDELDQTYKKILTVITERMEQLENAKNFVVGEETSVIEKIDRISKMITPVDADSKLNDKFKEWLKVESLDDDLKQEIIKDFIEYVDEEALVYYQLLIEWINPGLEFFGDDRKELAERLSTSFEVSAKKYSHLDWQKLSKVSKRLVTYQLVFEWQRRLRNRIKKGLKRCIQTTSAPDDIGISTSSNANKVAATTFMLAYLYRSDMKVLVDVKASLRDWLNSSENLKLDSLETLENLEALAVKDFNTATCAPAMTYQNDPLDQNDQTTTDTYKRVRGLENRCFQRMLVTLKKLNYQFSHFRKGEFSHSDAQNEAVRYGGYTLTTNYLFNFVAPKLLKDLKLLESEKSIEVLRDSNQLLLDLKSSFGEFYRLLENYNQGDKVLEDVFRFFVNDLKNLRERTPQSSSEGSSKWERKKSYFREKFLSSYDQNMMILFNSYRSYYFSAIEGKGKRVTKLIGKFYKSWIKELVELEEEEEMTRHLASLRIDPNVNQHTAEEEEVARVLASLSLGPNVNQPK